MAVIKWRRCRGYKPETRQAVTLTTDNLAMERGLQELLSVFGLLIGPHISVVVVASSHVAARNGDTGKTSASTTNTWVQCSLRHNFANVFPSPNLCINSFHISQKLFQRIRGFSFFKFWHFHHPFQMQYLKISRKTGSFHFKRWALMTAEQRARQPALDLTGTWQHYQAICLVSSWSPSASCSFSWFECNQ